TSRGWLLLLPLGVAFAASALSTLSRRCTIDHNGLDAGPDFTPYHLNQTKLPRPIWAIRGRIPTVSQSAVSEQMSSRFRVVAISQLREVLRAWAQQPGRIYRLGGLFSAAVSLGFPGRTRACWLHRGGKLTIDDRGFDSRGAQVDRHAAELVSAGVD